MATAARHARLIVPDRKAGHLNQCIGVAERLGVAFEVTRPPRPGLMSVLVPNTAAPAADAPLVIASGRGALAPALQLASRRGPRPFVVFLGPPRRLAARFDLCWSPAHDRLPAGPTLIATPTSPGRIAPETLSSAAGSLAARLGHLPPPRVAVLVGGASRAYRFGATEAEELGTVLSGFARSHEASLLVTFSRRTGGTAERILTDRLAGERVWIWDGTGESPLAGMLGLADATIVTADSVNMLSEAALTGRPVYAWPLPGGRAKFDRFHRALLEAGVMRWFDGGLADWRYRPLDPAATIAREIARRLGW